MSREEIIQECVRFGIENFQVNDDGSVNVDGDVLLINQGLRSIPLRFNRVTGDFDCSYNYLKSLEGCPSVVYGTFDCSNNFIQSLVGAPSTVYGNFVCSYTPLLTLEHSPISLGGNFCYEVDSEYTDALSPTFFHPLLDMGHGFGVDINTNLDFTMSQRLWTINNIIND